MKLTELKLRIQSQIKYKIMLAIILTSVVYSLYILIQHYPFFPAKTLHQTSIDEIIPFMPGSVYLYESIWLFMPIAPWLMKFKDELNQYLLGIIIVSFTCFSIFIFFPTAITRPKDAQTLNFVYLLLIKTDSELNAFPSLHVVLTVFHALCCRKIFNSGLIFIWLWGIGIIVSTLLTKQHYFIDIIGGFIVGFIGYLIIKR